MDIAHITSPDIALKVAVTGVFIGNALPADAGMNGFPKDKPHYAERSVLAAKGAVLYFRWDGPTETTTNMSVPAPANTLYHQPQWRTFIPRGTNKYLFLVGIELQHGFEVTLQPEQCGIRCLIRKIFNSEFRRYHDTWHSYSQTLREKGMITLEVPVIVTSRSDY